MDQIDLIKLGFSSKEAKVYLAALELGSASTLELARKTGLNRSSIYPVIENLIQKGLIASIKTGKKNVFVCEAPNKLKQLFQKELSRISEQGSQLENLLPELESIFCSSSRPKVRYFDGRQGIFEMHSICIENNPPEIVSFVSDDNLKKIIPLPEETLSKKRIKNKIPSRMIYSSTTGPNAELHNPVMLRQAKYYPNQNIPLNASISVYNDSVSLISLTKNINGVLIENKSIADTMRSIFETVWKILD